MRYLVEPFVLVLFGDFGIYMMPQLFALGGFTIGVDFGYLGGALLHVGDLVHDALVHGGSCPWRLEVTLEDDDAVLL